jgi:ketosteroid isomerase-like protein
MRDILERWKDAYKASQAAQVSALYTEDAYYLTQHFASGIIHGRADIQAYVQRGV